MPRMLTCLRPSSWIALTLALSACGGNVVVDGSATATAASNAVIVKVPAPNGICSLSAATAPADAVFLLVASQPVTCAEPEPVTDLLCGSMSSFWEACIPLASALAPTTINFDAYTPNVELIKCATSSVGLIQSGALAITAVDPSSMTFTLSDPSQQPQGNTFPTADGTYDAIRCP